MLWHDTNGMAVSFLDDYMIIKDVATPAHDYFGDPFAKLTFTRASAATYVNSNGHVTDAAIDAPRIGYDPISRAIRGLLIEEQRTNLLIRSQALSNVAWTPNNATVGAAAGNGVDGVAGSGFTFTATGAGLAGIDSIATVLAANTPLTLSVWAKAGDKHILDIGFYDASLTDEVDLFVNLSTGEIEASDVGGGVALDSSIVAYPNGWYRISLTGTLTIANPRVYLYMDNASGAGSTISFQFPQLEAGAFPLSYIKTVAAAVTRGADVCSLLTSLTPWDNAEVTLFSESFIEVASATLNSTAFEVADGTANNRHNLFHNITTMHPNAVIYASEVNQLTKLETASKLGQISRISLAADAISANTSFDGEMPSVPGDIAGITMPVCTTFRFGRTAAGSPLNGFLRKAMSVPRRAPNYELIAMTKSR